MTHIKKLITKATINAMMIIPTEKMSSITNTCNIIIYGLSLI